MKLRCLGLAGLPLLAIPALGVAQSPRVTAFRVTQPPIVDGEVGTEEWKDVPRLTGFVDPFTGRAAADQTEAWIAYDDAGLYVAFRCVDANPESMVAREIRPGSFFDGEDTVGVRINPFGTRSDDGRSRFTINLLNTQSEEISGGRASKREWRGEWFSATKRLPNGWSAEILIPWKVLNYPAGERLTMDLNLERFQGRTRIGSRWANTTQSDQPQMMGYWEGVVPPRRGWRTRVQTLVYAAPEWNRNRAEFRSGADIRVQPTPTLTAIGSINPDFRNIEQEVAGIDFTRTERYLDDARPFFSEGNDFFQLGGEFSFGQLFYSNRIGAFDYGTKAFGKLNPQMSVGALTTVDTGNATASVGRFAMNFGPFASAYGYATRYSTPGAENNAVGAHGWKRWANWFMDTDLASEESLGRTDTAGSVGLGYEVPGWFAVLRSMWIEPRFAPSLGYIPWTDRKGSYIYSERFTEYRTGPLRDVYFWVDMAEYRNYEGGLQERGINNGVGITLRNDMRVNLSRNQRQYADGLDSTIGGGITFNNSNRFRRFGAYYEDGQRGDRPSRYISGSGSLRVLRKLDLGFERSLLTRDGTDALTILTMGYEIDRKRGVTGRLVQRDRDSNVYFAFRNGGLSGAEFYVIVGDPNERRTQKRVSIKMVWPF